ncbi:MAG: DUF1538 domain-containing protein [Methanohalobium sp.]|uniref:DUF1538 domain-containing protein n=1 Tax=Methanohalobium sp. TaxID=2837493 RepID=UPI00397C2BD3
MNQVFKENMMEVLQATLPIIVSVLFFILVFVGPDLELILPFLSSAVMVILGMGLFLMGVKLGMLPMGESIGSELPKHGSLLFIIVITFILAFLVTIAEPDVRVLSSMFAMVSEGVSRTTLIISIALGLGSFVVISMLRIAYGIPIKYLFTVGYLFVIILSFFTPPEFLAISFDAGGVTTGPLAVPVILALGIGIASMLGGKSELSDGFGLIGLASIGPIITVMLMGVFI